ncbi:MAG: hypothetical protein ACREQM_22375 [Candidatus Dormibacteraceae bacterium]
MPVPFDRGAAPVFGNVGRVPDAAAAPVAGLVVTGAAEACVLPPGAAVPPGAVVPPPGGVVPAPALRIAMFTWTSRLTRPSDNRRAQDDS